MHHLGTVALVVSLTLAVVVGDAVAQQPPASGNAQTPPQNGAQPSTAVQVTPPPGLTSPPASPPPQPQSAPPATAQPQPSPQSPPAAERRVALEVDVSALLGSAVRNAEGRDIGKVSRLMVDPRDGRVTTLVIGMGGTLGIGEKHLAVPFNAVRVGQDRQRLVVTVDQRLLDQMPRAESPASPEPAASPATNKK